MIGEKLNDDDDDDDDDVVDIDFDNVVVDKGLMHSLTSVYPKFDGDGVVLDVVVVHGDGVEEDSWGVGGNILGDDDIGSFSFCFFFFWFVALYNFLNIFVVISSWDIGFATYSYLPLLM